MRRSQKKYFAGIDVGSRTTKAVLIKGKSSIISAIRPTGINVSKTAETVLTEALQKISADRRQVQSIVGTGYGRVSLSFVDATITELSCHALGANYIDPDVRTVIDIGGQDSKALHLDHHGNMVDFVMNDKCAAGTGKFLEIVARTLEMNLRDLSNIDFKGTTPCTINSMCVVFVESEIISLLARGEKTANIIAGVNRSFSIRIGNMAKRLGLKNKCVLTGGVAKNRGLAGALSSYLGISFPILDIDPQLNGALGAAVLAQKSSQ